MSSSNPTVVLIPGAWHTPEAYEELTPFLDAAGFPHVSVSLPSVGVSPGVEDFGPDVAAVRFAVSSLADQCKDVVILMHSYGGLPGTEALKGLGKREREATGKEGGVIRLIYVAAIAPQLGESAGAVLKRLKTLHNLGIEGVAGSPSTDGTSTVFNGKELFYQDLPEEKADYYNNKMKTQSIGVFGSSLSYEAWRDIPTAYLITAKDQAIAPVIQESMAVEIYANMVETIEASHSPFLSCPDKVASFIERAALTAV